MKTKQILAGLLSAALCVSLLTACGKSETKNEQSKQSTASTASEQSSEASGQSKTDENSEQSKTENSRTHTIYIRDSGKSPEITAVFFNSSSGESEEVAMTKTGEDDDSFTYSCEGNTDKYNMVRLKYQDAESMDIAFNSFVSGWYLWNDELLPYVQGQVPEYEPEYETKVFKFDDSEREVYIWTPDDYDAKSSEKYAAIYELDGQTALSVNLSSKYDNSYQVWNVSEHVRSMMAETDNKAIIVAINTTDNRTSDLFPDITGADNKEKRGREFANFICDTIMPLHTGKLQCLHRRRAYSYSRQLARRT